MPHWNARIIIARDPRPPLKNIVILNTTVR
jgi:hypothetical protein